jgi:hypothetical protein
MLWIAVVERFVELGSRSGRAQPLGQGAREARDDAGVARETRVRLVAAVPAGQRDDLEHPRVLDERR